MTTPIRSNPQDPGPTAGIAGNPLGVGMQLATKRSSDLNLARRCFKTDEVFQQCDGIGQMQRPTSETAQGVSPPFTRSGLGTSSSSSSSRPAGILAIPTGVPAEESAKAEPTKAKATAPAVTTATVVTTRDTVEVLSPAQETESGVQSMFSLVTPFAP